MNLSSEVLASAARAAPMSAGAQARPTAEASVRAAPMSAAEAHAAAAAEGTLCSVSAIVRGKSKPGVRKMASWR